MTPRKRIAQALCLFLATPAFADFRYEETTKVTGGAIVNMVKFAGAFSHDSKKMMEPTTSTVLVKGNRMAHIDASRTEIVDLDRETVTRIDHEKKQYTVMTFEQIRERAQRQMEEAQQRAQQQPTPQPIQSSQPTPKITFKVDVKDTGASKQVAGLDAKETILSLTMEATDEQTGNKGAFAMNNDMWMVPEIPGYQEVRDFNRRMAIKMGPIYGGAMRHAAPAMQQPGSAEGTVEMSRQMSKLKGMPVLQVMRIGSSANGQPLPAASEAPLPQSNSPATPSAGGVARNSATSALSSKLGVFGGLGGFGRKHKDQTQDTSQQQADPAQGGATSVLMETTVETSSFSSEPIDPARFNVPAGYTQVAADSMASE